MELALATADFSDVTALAIDETSPLAAATTSPWQPTPMRAGCCVSPKGAMPRPSQRSQLQVHGCAPEQVESVSIDMSPAYINGWGQHLPNARITF